MIRNHTLRLLFDSHDPTLSGSMILGKAYMAPCTVLQLSPGMLFRLPATISARRARLAST